MYYKTEMQGLSLVTETKIVEMTSSQAKWISRHDLQFEDINSGRRFYVFNTHFDHRAVVARKESSKLILQKIDEIAGSNAVILMGDFNEWHRWGGTLRRLQKLFGPLPAPATFPSRYPLLALDRILVRPAGLLTAVKAFRGASAPIASDHLPLTAQVVLP